MDFFDIFGLDPGIKSALEFDLVPVILGLNERVGGVVVELADDGGGGFG